MFQDYMNPYSYKLNNIIKWKITHSVKRGWDKEFWNEIFSSVLNNEYKQEKNKACSNMLNNVIKKLHDFNQDTLEQEKSKFLKKMFPMFIHKH